MRESCSPSWKDKGGPTCQAPMTTTDTSGSKDGPDTSREVPGYTTQQHRLRKRLQRWIAIYHPWSTTTIEGSEYNQEDLVRLTALT